MNRVECIHCGTLLPDGHTSPCPNCGKKGRKISVGTAGELDLAGALRWEKRREFYEKNRWASTILIAITLVAPFVGLVLIGWAGVIVGLLLGCVALLVGPTAVTKVREIERGG